MKKLFAIIAITSFTFVSATRAQTIDPKLEWANKAVAIQQSLALELLAKQLADGATQDVLQNWGPKLQSEVAPAKMEQARDSLNAELKKYFDDVSKTINAKVNKASAAALVPAYMERFSIDELKQLVAFFESSTIKKYQSAAPELGSIFVKQLVEETRTDVTAHTKQFDAAATKIIGTSPSAKTPTTAPAAADKSKPPAKK